MSDYVFSAGDQVLVYPHNGGVEQAAAGRVVLISKNQHSICVAFKEKPRFDFTENGVWMVLGYGMVLMTLRMQDGAWESVFEQGNFEILPLDS
jgi:hypothetical protein